MSEHVLRVVITVLWCALLIQGCEDGETQYFGRCFASVPRGTKTRLELRWHYFLSSSLTSLQRDRLADQLRSKVIDNLGAVVCPEPFYSCDDLSVKVTPGNSGVLVNCSSREAPRDYGAHSVQSYVRDSISSHDNYTLPEEFAEGQIRPSEISVEVMILCPEGHEVLDNNKCGECTLGYFLDSSSGECNSCPRSTYQDDTGQSSCKDCPTGQTTYNNQRSPDHCKDLCLEGTYYSTTQDACRECGHGKYNPDEGKKECLYCPQGTTTYLTNSTTQQQCTTSCQDGYQLLENGNCLMCPRGSYLTQPNHRTCQPCPLERTTSDSGSDSPDDCSIVNCSAGHYATGEDPATTTCEPCPQHTYRTAAMSQHQCMPCPPYHRTDHNASQSPDNCRFFCEAGSYISTAGSSPGPPTCVGCPVDTYLPAGAYYATECIQCPSGLPRTASTNSTSLTDCRYPECVSGEEVDPEETTRCRQCDYGYYQAVTRPTTETCVRCPQSGDIATHTRGMGAKSVNDCKRYCPSGWELDENDTCVQCKIGFYKSNRQLPSGSPVGWFSRCIECRSGWITDEEGATDDTLCNIKSCLPGSYREGRDTCRPCRVGTYQDLKWQTSCKPCPVESTTNQTGTTSLVQCNVFPNRTWYYIKIGLQLDWQPQYYNKSTSEYYTFSNDIKRKVASILQSSSSYRNESQVTTMAPGSVLVHLRALFSEYSPSNTLEIATLMNMAVNSGAIGGTPTIPDSTQVIHKTLGNTDSCGEGHYLDYTTGACTPCSTGSYQLPGLVDVCIECPPTFTTETTATTGKQAEVCHRICSSGQESINNVCVACARGFYKPSEGIDACIPCADGFTTQHNGALYCIASCSPGYYSNAKHVCTACGYDFYNDEANQVTCKACPDGGQTTKEGSTKAAHCKEAGTPAGVLAGAVAGVVAFIITIIIIVVLVCFWRRKRSNLDDMDGTEENKEKYTKRTSTKRDTRKTISSHKGHVPDNQSSPPRSSSRHHNNYHHHHSVSSSHSPHRHRSTSTSSHPSSRSVRGFDDHRRATHSHPRRDRNPWEVRALDTAPTRGYYPSQDPMAAASMGQFAFFDESSAAHPQWSFADAPRHGNSLPPMGFGSIHTPSGHVVFAGAFQDGGGGADVFFGPPDLGSHRGHLSRKARCHKGHHSYRYRHERRGSGVTITELPPDAPEPPPSGIYEEISSTTGGDNTD